MDPRIVRMVDANGNRCREALRVMEDVARFGLNHGELARQIKGIRHELRDVLEQLAGGELRLQACRDTPGDSGTAIKLDGEGKRTGLRGVAIAAGKRAGEALRVIEEGCKVEGGDGNVAEAEPRWRRIERLRYRLYECEKRLTLAMGAGSTGASAAGSRVVQWRVCVLVTTGACLLDWREVVQRSIDGGADCIQLREKDLNSRTCAAIAKEMRTVIGDRATMIVNDRVEIALLSGADGVHLGQEDLSVESVRVLAGDRLIVGVSTHNLEEAHRAAAEGADYCGVGAMFPTATKVRAASGATYLRDYLADQGLARIPHLAIGGITPENVAELVGAGCRGVAVSSAVCRSTRPEEVCAMLRGAIDDGALPR